MVTPRSASRWPRLLSSFAAISPARCAPPSDLLRTRRLGERGKICHTASAQPSPPLITHGGCPSLSIQRHPDFSRIFDEAMEGLSTLGSAAVLAAYDFSQFRTLVDVGGGNGALLATLLRQHGALRGKLADLPHVVSRAAEVLNRAGVANRCEIIGCDFFETVPSGGDAYVLKSILHDWDDTHAMKILRNCHRAMTPSSTLLLLERVLPEQPAVEAALRYLIDLTMLVMTPGGRERTPAEFRKLLEGADFGFLGITPTGGPYDIVTARKI